MYIFAELGGVVAEILLAYIYLNSFSRNGPFSGGRWDALIRSVESFLRCYQ